MATAIGLIMNSKCQQTLDILIIKFIPVRTERVSTSDHLALKFCPCLFPDYKPPLCFLTKDIEHPEGCELY